MSRPRIAVLFAALAVCCAPVAGAHGAEIEHNAISGTVPPGLSVSPSKLIVAAPPGETVLVHVEVTNADPEPVRVSASAVLGRGSQDAGSFVDLDPTATGNAVRNAARWVTFPFATTTVPARSVASFDVEVDVPRAARAGAHPVLLVFTVPTLRSTSSDAIGVAGSGGVATTVVLQVPGDAESDVKVRDVDGPKVVGSGSRERFHVRVENTGDTLLDLDAQVELTAPWGSSRLLDADPQQALPGGRRSFSIPFDDPPLVGRYTPRVTVTGGKDSGVRVTRDLPAVWVLPPWWLLALLAVAVFIPAFVSWRRRR